MELSRNVSAPGLCKRPLRFTYVTLPLTWAPALTTTLPCSTISCVRVPLHISPVCAVAELRDVLRRTVAWLPAGIVAAQASDAAIIKSRASKIDLENLIACLQCESPEQLHF